MYASAASPAGFSLRAHNSHAANGTAIVSSGNNVTAQYLTDGGGGAFTGLYQGSYSYGTNTTDGVGAIGIGNGVTSISTPAVGAGVSGEGVTFGVVGYGYTVAVANDHWGGYFDYLASANGFSYVGGRTGGTDYGILSSGTKSTMVKDAQGNNRIMYCPEAPEVLFEDYGTGQLVNGTAHIELDPIFTRNIAVSEDKPIKVFVQLEGNCKGVFVANKTATGFDVVELDGGTSNIKFTWHVIANRADVIDPVTGVTSKYAGNRFPIGPNRQATTTKEMNGSVAPTVEHKSRLKEPTKRK
jgi:hypothetical protein